MSSVSLNLENRHILITGGSSGLGRVTATLASQLGARVSLVARREPELQATVAGLTGEGHSFWPFDLTQLSEIGSLVKAIVAAGGPLGGLVHCAGVGQNRPLAVTDPEFVQKTMTVNFNAFVELVRIVAKKKHSNDGASLVAISSVASLKGDKSQGAYAASKAAINGIVPPLAKELASRLIRVNAVAFGMIKTEMFNSYQESGCTLEALSGQYLGLGEPEDAARVLCFLLSDYSKLITGSILAADNGYLS